MSDAVDDKYLKGRGAQINTHNRFEKQVVGAFHIEGGQVNDSRPGKRMSGEGNIADSIKRLFQISVKKFMGEPERLRLNTSVFLNKHNAQTSLFDDLV
jgi:hypothetical protein